MIMLMMALPEALELAHLSTQVANLGDPVEFVWSVSISILALLSLQ
jgi:hypothetical protein